MVARKRKTNREDFQLEDWHIGHFYRIRYKYQVESTLYGTCVDATKSGLVIEMNGQRNLIPYNSMVDKTELKEVTA